MLTPGLVKSVASGTAINTRGHHGIPHWMRVRANGLRLAHATGANPVVIELFALFHDSRRINEYEDPGHGARGAQCAARYRATGAFTISDDEFEQLDKACRGHTDEDVAAPCITVKTCWDADRLDLGRVGILPDPQYLHTDAAKDPDKLEWAYAQSLKWLERWW